MFLGREPFNENFPSGSARTSDGKNIEYSCRLVENFRFCPSENSFRFSSAILLSKIKSLFLNVYTSPQESRHYFNYLLSREVCTHLQIKRFPLMKLWYITWMYGGSKFQNNNTKSTHLIFILFKSSLSRNLLLIRLIIITLV